MRLWSLKDYFRQFRWLLCTALVVCALANESARADPAQVNLRLRISVKEKDSQILVQNAQITLQRHGSAPNGSELKEIKITIENGRLNAEKSSAGVRVEGDVLVRGDTDFQLTGSPHQILVTSRGFDQYSKELTDEELQKAFAEGQTLLIPVELSRTPDSSTAGQGSGSANSNLNANASAPAAKLADRVPPPGAISQIRDAMNYWLWLLGLVIVSFFGFWLVLVILARILRNDRMERGLLKSVPWLTGVFIWPFGFRLRWRVKHKNEIDLDGPVSCLQQIHNGFAELADPESAKRKPIASLQTIEEALTKLAGSEARKFGAATYLVGINNSVKKLAQERPPKGGDEQDENIQSMIKNVVKEGFREVVIECGLKVPKIPSPPPPEPESRYISARPSDPRSISYAGADTAFDSLVRAKAVYEQFLDNFQSDSKPVYLEAEAKSSIEGKLADGNVYLSQVGSSQAPFILFQDDRGEGIGWVFPNPSQGFDKSTLNDVFPYLDEQQFNSAKQRIEPASVSKVGERRWRIVDL